MSTIFTDLSEVQKSYLEDCFTLHHSVLAYRQQAFKASVENYGLEFTSTVHWDALTVQSGSTIVFSTTSDAPSHLASRLCTTDRFDQFKAWVGLPDVKFEQGIFPLPEQPSTQWIQAKVPNAEHLTDVEKENIQTAGFAYLFGDSKRVESYQAAIETLHAPFEAVVYALDRLTIEPGGCLIVEGNRPVILLFNHLTIVQGGIIQLYCPTTMTVQQLHKTTELR